MDAVETIDRLGDRVGGMAQIDAGFGAAKGEFGLRIIQVVGFDQRERGQRLTFERGSYCGFEGDWEGTREVVVIPSGLVVDTRRRISS